ncbi:hypothetical protein O2K51_14510 [Apibacter raozihei]|uniref:hypothetical protein n=1 Tax=Apibacter raozihei TaxID=2500547 RepID=UPI000FE32437|nr:hypothetical protein [Apibacter raozihei]
MKFLNKIISLLIILFNVFLLAQKNSDIDTLHYNVVINKNESKNFKTGTNIKNYIASDKNIYKSGDTIILGEATGEGQSAFSKKRNFQYIFYGKPTAVLFKGIRYVDEKYKGYKATIEQIKFNKGSMGQENYIFFYIKPLPGTNFLLLDNYITVTMVDNAILSGEIIPLNKTRPLTYDEAIEILKNKKMELELELITQEEFNRIKENLKPIINK